MESRQINEVAAGRFKTIMFDSIWLPLTVIVVGLLTRKILGGKAYGAIADMLLGISGVFA